MRSGRALAAAVCGPILALSACSDGGGGPVVLPTATAPTTSPTETASPASPPTTEPTPTTTLVLPDEHVPEVDEFVRGFFAAYNAAQDSGDFAAFDAMYLPQCTGCIQMRDELEGWLADGGSVEGADWVILQQASFQHASNFTGVLVAYRTAGVATGEEIPQTSARLVNLAVRGEPGLSMDGFTMGDA